METPAAERKADSARNTIRNIDSDRSEKQSKVITTMMVEIQQEEERLCDQPGGHPHTYTEGLHLSVPPHLLPVKLITVINIQETRKRKQVDGRYVQICASLLPLLYFTVQKSTLGTAVPSKKDILLRCCDILILGRRQLSFSFHCSILKNIRQRNLCSGGFTFKTPDLLQVASDTRSSHNLLPDIYFLTREH